jgi:hypothetical protein
VKVYSVVMRLPSVTPQPAAFSFGSILCKRVSDSFIALCFFSFILSFQILCLFLQAE